MCLKSYANNKGADQPAHQRSLISAFVIHCLDSVMSLVSVTKISSLMLASVAEQAKLSLTWSETPEDTFSHDEANITVWSGSALFAILIHYSLVNQISANFRTIITYFRVSEFFPFLWYAIAIVFEPRHDRTCLQEFPTRPDTNWPAQPQKLA